MMTMMLMTIMMMAMVMMTMTAVFGWRASRQVIKIAQSLPVKADLRLRCEDDEDDDGGDANGDGDFSGGGDGENNQIFKKNIVVQQTFHFR